MGVGGKVDGWGWGVGDGEGTGCGAVGVGVSVKVGGGWKLIHSRICPPVYRGGDGIDTFVFPRCGSVCTVCPAECAHALL